MRTRNLLCPSDGKGEAAEAADPLSEGPKVVQTLQKTFPVTKCHEAHHIDQRNAPNTKMYVGVEGGGQASQRLK